MNNAKIALKNFHAALDFAGYSIEGYEKAALIKELEDRFVFMVEDDNVGGLLIGEFWKARASFPADFGGDPIWEGDDFAEGAQFMVDWIAEL